MSHCKNCGYSLPSVLEQLPADPAERFRGITELLAELYAARHLTVDAMRAAGMSWSQIGAAVDKPRNYVAQLGTKH